MKKIIWAVFALLLLSSCNKDKNVVVVYTSVDQVFAEPVLKEFEKQTGIKVKALYDTEETKSTGVLNRIIAEKNNPQCDLFWSGDPVRAVVLKQKGIARPYQSPQAKGIPSVYKDPEHYWTGFSSRARVILYNKKLISPEDIPHSIFDMVKEKYKGQFALANPLFGTTTFHFAAIFDALGDSAAIHFFQAVKQNGVIIAASNGDVKRLVIDGKVAWGFVDTDDAFEAMKESSDVAMVFPDQDSLGTLIIPNTITLIKGSPHPDNAQKLADFLLSPQTEAMLARLCAQMPLHKGVHTPENVPSLDNIRPMKIDYDHTARKLVQIQDFLKQWAQD